MLVEVGGGSRIHMAAGESVELKPEGKPFVADLTLSGGSVMSLPVRDGVLRVPVLEAPELVDIRWRDGEGKTLYHSTLDISTGHYFSIEELKRMDESDDFSDKTDGEIRAARDAAVETFEVNSNRSFVGRIGKVRTYDGGFVTLDHCDVWGIKSPCDYRLVSDCQAVGPSGPADIVYIYGKDEVPQRVRDVVMQLAAYYLRDDVTPSRATGEATEAGFLRYSIAGRDGATGLPEVDAVIEQFGRKRYSVA